MSETGNDPTTRGGATRRRFIQAGAAVGAALAMPAIRASAATRVIKLGFVSPKTGPIAAFAAADDFILRGVRDAIKDGVTVAGKTYKVEILARDSQSNTGRGAEVAQQLILQDKVDILMASSSADTTNPVADQAEVNGTPCITTDTPWEPHFFGRGGNPAKGFEWTYHFFWGVGELVKSYVGMWNAIPTNRVLGALWANDADGVALSNAEHGLPPAFKAAGFTVIDTGLFTPLASDFSAQIAKLKAANAEIVTGVLTPPDFATFWAQCGQQGYKPKAVTVAKALLFPAAVEALGDRGAGLSTEVWWSPSHPYKSGLTGQSAGELCAAYMADSKKQWTQPIGFKHAVLEVAIDVLKRTKDIDDPASIRDAIAATNYRSIVGPVSWAKGPVKNVSLTPLSGGQWERGSKFKYDLVVTNNDVAPEIPVGRKFMPISY
jgi:branched-chain amino acid transport system substrate-binding protein